MSMYITTCYLTKYFLQCIATHDPLIHYLNISLMYMFKNTYNLNETCVCDHMCLSIRIFKHIV